MLLEYYYKWIGSGLLENVLGGMNKSKIDTFNLVQILKMKYKQLEYRWKADLQGQLTNLYLYFIIFANKIVYISKCVVFNKKTYQIYYNSFVI